MSLTGMMARRDGAMDRQRSALDRMTSRRDAAMDRQRGALAGMMARRDAAMNRMRGDTASTSGALEAIRRSNGIAGYRMGPSIGSGGAAPVGRKPPAAPSPLEAGQVAIEEAEAKQRSKRRQLQSDLLDPYNAAG